MYLNITRRFKISARRAYKHAWVFGAHVGWDPDEILPCAVGFSFGPWMVTFGNIYPPRNPRV